MKNKITMIMPTYKRNMFIESPDHPALINANNEIVDKVIILWHNIGEIVPESVFKNLEKTCKGKYEIVFPKENTLNNRFLDIKEIETDCIVAIDDDFNVTKLSLEAMFKIWNDEKDTLVGCTPRLIDPDRKIYSGNAAHLNSNTPYNFLLTQYAMFHRKYLDLYWENKEALASIDKNFNAEDIYFNYIHSKYSSKKMYVHHDKKVKTWKNIQNNGISKTDSSHLKKRFKMCKDLEEAGYKRPEMVKNRLDLI